jgi:hypothetical protein
MGVMAMQASRGSVKTSVVKSTRNSNMPSKATNQPSKMAAKSPSVIVGNPLFVARPRSVRVGGDIRVMIF